MTGGWSSSRIDAHRDVAFFNVEHGLAGCREENSPSLPPTSLRLTGQRSGKISMSNCSSVHPSMSVPSNGSRSLTSAMSCSKPWRSMRVRSKDWGTEMVGMSNHLANQWGSGRSYPASRRPLTAAVSWLSARRCFRSSMSMLLTPMRRSSLAKSSCVPCNQ